jgi:hypothetical protein
MSVAMTVNLLQRGSAVLTVHGIRFMPFGHAFRANLCRHRFVTGMSQLGRYNPRRYDDHAVAKDHHAGGKRLSDRGCWRNVPVTDGRHRHNGPVHTLRDRVEPAGDRLPVGIDAAAFDQMHCGPNDNNSNQNERQKDGDFGAGRPNCPSKSRGFRQHVAQLEDPKGSQQAECADDCQAMGAWSASEKRQRDDVCRQDCQQVDDAKKAESVSRWTTGTGDPHAVLKREQLCEKPLGADQQIGVQLANLFDALEHHDHNTKQNRYEQYDIKELAGRSVGFKNDFVPAFTPGAPARLATIDRRFGHGRHLTLIGD